MTLFTQSEADSLVSTVPIPHNYSPASAMKLEEGRLVAVTDYPETDNLRQKKPTYYARNGAIYAFTTQCLLEKDSLYGDTTIGYEMARDVSTDIDEPFDLELCEWLMNRAAVS